MLAQGIGGKYCIRIAMLFRKHYIMFMVSEQNVVYVWVKKKWQLLQDQTWV